MEVIMKNKNLFFILVAAALIINGCGGEGPLSTELTESQDNVALAKVTRIPVSGTFDFSPARIVDPGQMWVTNNILHIRNQIYVSPVSGELEGTGTVIFNADIDQTTGNGPVYGSDTLEVTCNVCTPVGLSGTFTGHFSGKSTAGKLSANVVSQGSGGFAGMILRAFNEDTNGPEAIEYNGVILVTKN